MCHAYPSLPNVYTLEKRLQMRGAVHTWQAIDTRQNKKVIVKTLDASATDLWTHYERLEREAEVLKSLSVKGIPRLLDFSALSTAGTASLMMEHLPGQTLRAHMESGRKWTETEARQLAKEALDLLSALHTAEPSLIHRDIKPENLLLHPDGFLQMLDLGAVQAGTGGKFTTMGTFAYMAPEQLHGQAVPASDLYGLGVTLVEMLSGLSVADLPRDGLYLRLQEVLHVKESFHHWLEHLVAPFIEQRFVSAEAAKTALLSPAPLTPVHPHRALQTSTRKTQLSPAVWLEDTPEALDIQIRGSSFGLQHLLLYGGFTVGTFAMSILGAMFSYKFLDLIRAPSDLRWGIPMVLGYALFFGTLLLGKRQLGQSAATHQLILDADGLYHSYDFQRAIGRVRKKEKRIPLAKIRWVRFYPTRIFFALQGLPGLDLHVVSCQVQLTPEVRQRLGTAMEKRGVEWRR